MSPIFKTLVIAVIAAVTSMIAAFYYPWPEAIVQSELLNQPLFKNFTSEKAKKLTITRFNAQSGQLDSIQIQLSKVGWVLPNSKNFPVTNANQNSVSVNSFDNRIVLQEETDEAERHPEYGVVDPTLFKTITDKSTLGVKVTVYGETGNELGSMIVGKTLKESRPNEFGEVQHYIALPGKPAVYVVELNPRAFPTEFDRWVDPNLFGIPFQSIPLDIKITHALLPPEDFGKKEPKRIYRAHVKGRATVPSRNLQQEAASGQVQLDALEVPDKEGKFVDTSDFESEPTTWARFNLTLRRILFSGVVKKTDELAGKFTKPSAENSADDFEGLKAVGFRFLDHANGMPQFESSKGQLELLFESGIRYKLMFGTIALETTTDQNELNRYAMLTGEFDESLMPSLPEEPKDGSEEEKKEYLRKVKQREEMTKMSKGLIKTFNDRHAGWVYMIPETVCNRLIPDLDFKIEAKETKPAENEPSKDAPQQPEPGKSDPENKDAGKADSNKADSNKAEEPESKKKAGNEKKGDESNNDPFGGE